jgi:micrococcal nuclease
MINYLAILLFSISSAALASSQCAPKQAITQWFKAEYAINGSTLIINNKRVKLNGLYAPQRARKQKFNTPEQPLAKAAQTYLNKLIANSNLEVGLIYDQNKTDHMGRLLAHAFLKDGRNLQEEMLRAGFAIQQTIADNDLYNRCYFSAENWARSGQYQLWDQLHKNPDSHFPLAKSSEMHTQDEGFKIVQGRVKTIKKGANYWIINLDTTGIRIHKNHWSKFNKAELEKLEGQIIEVRGFNYQFNRRMFMLIEHPHAINHLQPK